MQIEGVIIQESYYNYAQWVTAYKVQHSDDMITWQYIGGITPETAQVRLFIKGKLNIPPCVVEVTTIILNYLQTDISCHSQF